MVKNLTEVDLIGMYFLAVWGITLGVALVAGRRAAAVTVEPDVRAWYQAQRASLRARRWVRLALLTSAILILAACLGVR